MRVSVVDNKTDVAIDSIEWEEGSNWPVPDGCRLDDPVKYPYTAPEPELPEAE